MIVTDYAESVSELVYCSDGNYFSVETLAAMSFSSRTSSVWPVWHPFTQHALEPPPRKIVHAEGAYLTGDDGQRIIDAISSWWVITHGHRHPHIVAAIKTQAER